MAYQFWFIVGSQHLYAHAGYSDGQRSVDTRRRYAPQRDFV